LHAATEQDMVARLADLTGAISTPIPLLATVISVMREVGTVRASSLAMEI
jgi:hypothetical protein